MSNLIKKGIVALAMLIGVSSPAMAELIVSKELVTNQYFENGSYAGWSQVSGSSALRRYTTVDGVNRYYWLGGISGYSVIQSRKNMIYDESINAGLIGAGAVNFDFNVLLNSWSGDSDRVLAKVAFYDHSGALTAQYNTGWTSRNSWGQYTISGTVPMDAVSVSVLLYADRKSGTNNDGYVYAPSLNLSVTDQVALDTYGSLVVNAPAMLGAVSIGLMGLSGAAGRRKKLKKD